MSRLHERDFWFTYSKTVEKGKVKILRPCFWRSCIYLFSASGKSGIVLGLAVAGVCFPLVSSLTFSEI